MDENFFVNLKDLAERGPFGFALGPRANRANELRQMAATAPPVPAPKQIADKSKAGRAITASWSRCREVVPDGPRPVLF